MADDETRRISGSDDTRQVTGAQQRWLDDRYVLRGLIGSGGMADVELGLDTQLDRQVAIKILHGRYAGDQAFRRRFAREAQNAARLNHPNIVAVYDTGEADGRPFIVQEYVSGRSLAEVLASESLTPERAAEIAGDTALALDYAHERSLVHRDIKPGNILISDDGTVKVTDFGIARAIDAQDATQTAAVFGTAAYVAPEQAQGFEVDRRTDVYALGCVLYEMLTGQQPFQAETAVALAYQHVSAQPRPPSELAPEVTPELDGVVLRAMAKDPDDRYPTTRELNDDLQRAVGGLSVSPAAFSAYEQTQALATPQSYTATQALPQQEEYYEEPIAEERRPAKSRTGAWVFLILLLVAALIAAVLLAMGLFEATETQTIPDLEGATVSDAQAQLEALGFTVELGEPEEHPEIEQGLVVRTDPPADTEHPIDQPVEIIPSAGPETVEVPDVSGMSEQEARQELADADLEPGATTEEPSEEFDAGAVIRTEPAAGTAVQSGTTVNLVVSSGDPPVEVPDVIDRLEDDACARLADDGLECVVSREFHDQVAEDRVIRQDPQPGAQVPEGSPVGIVVSRGPEETDDDEDDEDDDDSGNGGNNNGNGNGGGIPNLPGNGGGQGPNQPPGESQPPGQG